MELNVTHRYDFKLGPIEQLAVEVLNDRYGRVTTRRWHNAREYALELATLQPEPKQSLYLAWHWLGATAITLLGLAGFIAYLKYGKSELSLLVTATTVLLLALLAGLFIYLFVLMSRRHIVFRTRFSGTPLVDIPIPLHQRQRGKEFARELSQLAQKNRARLHHSDDDLRAGELRMLRRLSEQGAISNAAYDKAKVLLLRLAS